MGDSAGSGVGSFVALEVGTSADVGAGLVEFVTFLASVQKVVGSFKKWNSDGSSGVDPLANTTISISPAVCLLTCPSAINLAMPSLSCCVDNLITSSKVCSESK